MAYYLYKKIRDHQKRSAEENLFNTPIPDSRRNEAPITGIQDNVEGVEKSSNELNNIRVSKDEARAMRKYRWRLIAGLVLPATVQGLNMTMIAGALPFIASDFRKSLPIARVSKDLKNYIMLTYTVQINSLNSTGSSPHTT